MKLFPRTFSSMDVRYHTYDISFFSEKKRKTQKSTHQELDVGHDFRVILARTKYLLNCTRSFGLSWGDSFSSFTGLTCVWPWPFGLDMLWWPCAQRCWESLLSSDIWPTLTCEVSYTDVSMDMVRSKDLLALNNFLRWDDMACRSGGQFKTVTWNWIKIKWQFLSMTRLSLRFS